MNGSRDSSDGRKSGAAQDYVSAGLVELEGGGSRGKWWMRLPQQPLQGDHYRECLRVHAWPTLERLGVMPVCTDRTMTASPKDTLGPGWSSQQKEEQFLPKENP